MSWLIDGVQLSTFAFNIANRSAGWKVPARRGDNLIIPGRNGAQWQPNKPFEQGMIQLGMWAVGANEDGTVPTVRTQEQQARDNLDKLTALFCQTSKLLEVVQISGKSFGLRNQATNPGFAGVADTAIPTYSNGILNPAMRRTTMQAQSTNLFRNPAMRMPTVGPTVNPANADVYTATSTPPSALIVAFGYGNLEGGYTLTDHAWSSRIDQEIALIGTMRVDMFAATELHEETDSSYGTATSGTVYFLNRLKAVDPDWALHVGNSGNHLFYRPSKYTAGTRTYYSLPGSRGLTVFPLTDKGSSLVVTVFVTHFRANDDDGTSRDQERRDESTFVANLAGKTPGAVIVTGDFNTYSDSSPYLHYKMGAQGYDGMRDKSSVLNGEQGTNTSGSHWIEDIYTKKADTLSDPELVPTGGASDHNGWLRANVTFAGTSTIGDLTITHTTTGGIFVDKMTLPGAGQDTLFGVNIVDDSVFTTFRYGLSPTTPGTWVSLPYVANKTWTSTDALTYTISGPLGSSAGFVTTNTQLFYDPFSKYQRTETPNLTLSNYYSPASYEVGLNTGDTPSGWSVQSGTTVNTTAATTGDQVSNPNGGTRVLQIKVTGSTTGNTIIGRRPRMVFATGAVPLYRARVRRVQATSTARTLQVQLVTVDDNDTTVNAGTWQTITLPPLASNGGGSDWVDVIYNSYAAGGDSLVVNNTTVTGVRVNWRTGSETWSNGDGFMLDCSQLNVANQTTGYFAQIPAPFWEGSSTFGGVRWNSTPGFSISRWDLHRDTRWTATTATSISNAYYAFADQPISDVVGTTTGFVAMGVQTGGTQVFESKVLGTPVTGRTYTLRATARALNGAACRIDLLRKRTGDSAYSVASTITFTGTAVAKPTTSRMTGNSTGYVGGTPIIAAFGDQYMIRVTVPVRTDGNHVLQVMSLSVADTADVAFSGSSPSDSDTLYVWEGAVYNSRSFAARRQVNRITTPVHSMRTLVVPTGYSAPQPMVEIESSGDGVAPSIATETIPLPVSNQGFYVRTEVSGRIFPGYNVPAPSARLDLALLDATGTQVGAVSSSVVKVNPIVNNSATFVPLAIRVPVESIPATATQLVVRLVSISARYGTALTMFRLAVLDNDVPPALNAQPSEYFDGSTSASTSWTGAIDDSTSVYWISSPSGWQVVSGVLSYDPGYFAARNTSATASVTIGHVMASTYDPGQYDVGLEAQAATQDATGSTVTGQSVRLDLLLLNGPNVVNTFTLATLSGNDAYTRAVNGTVTATDSWTEMRFVFTATSGSPAYVVGSIGSAYVYQVESDNPVPTIDFNKINNPDFGDGLQFWTVGGGFTPTPLTSGLGYTLTASSTTLTSNTVPVTAGATVYLGLTGRRGVSAVVRWLNSSGTTLSTSTPIFTTSTTTTSAAVALTAPASTTQAVVVVTGSGEVSWVYLGIGFSGHTDAGRFDYTAYPYMDGNTEPNGENTVWNGDPDNSVSQVVPALPFGWVVNADTNLHVLNYPTTAPPGSAAPHARLPRIEQGSTISVRSEGYPLGTTLAGFGSTSIEARNRYLSGQIAVVAETGLTLTVSVYGATNTVSTGTRLFHKNLATYAGEIITWHDLDLAAYPYAYVQLDYTETVSRVGYPIGVDNLMMLATPTPLGADYPGYFDGSTAGAGWSGLPNRSTSINYSGGRRAFAEVTQAIDMTSMAGGTRAEFVVDMTIPSSFWEDLVTATIPLTVSNAQLLAKDTSNQVALSPLAGTTAPIDDALITISITAAIVDLKITDVASGGYLSISGLLNTGDTLVIDNFAYTVRLTPAGGTETSVISRVVRGGSNQLLPVTAPYAGAAPLLAFSATGSGSLTATVVARRRYVIA